MHAYLIVGANSEIRKNYARERAGERGIAAGNIGRWFLLGNPDYPEESIKISDVRALIRWANLDSPTPRAALIVDANRLTVPAQHALLKTLEEPMGQAILFLTAPSDSSVLPTVRSRCRVVRLPQIKSADPSGILTALPSSADPSARLAWVYEQAGLTAKKTGAEKPFNPFQGTIPRSAAAALVNAFIADLSNLACRPALSAPLRGACLLHAARAHRRLNQNILPFLVLEQLALDIPALD